MKISIKILLIIVFTSATFYPQVSLNISDGMKVETSGGSYITLSGDLEENNTGYLKGKVTSGNRGADAISQFAGLIISAGAVDKITRTTGTAFSSSSPKTTLRYYVVENTTEVTSDITSEFIKSGVNGESNGIVNPFLYNNVVGAAANWKGYLDNSSTSNIIGATEFNIPSGGSNIVISEGVGVAAKLFLEGPYIPQSVAPPSMATNLSGSIPLTSPYSEDPRTVTSIPANTVDWVLIKLRVNTTPSTILSSRSVFLKNDGNLIDDLGNTSIGIPFTPGNYYISIRQRNHLEIMSSGAQSIDWLTP